MSSYSFSHQFYQRWTLAPEPVRAAIVQELTDITTLLRTDTPVEKFVFSQSDLDAYLDQLYNTHKAQLAAAKESADKQAKQAAEQQRLKEKEKKKIEAEKIKSEKDIESQQQVAQKQQDKNSVTDKIPDIKMSSSNQNNSDHSNAAADTIKNDDDNKIKGLSADQIDSTADKSKQSTTMERLPKDPKLSKGHEDLIHELGIHIDDYLSEQMAQLSEDLKSWLRAEISRQLTDQAQTIDRINKNQ